jgi:hypothetical protein
MPINYKNYPKNWKTEIRPAILERAKNKCEWCGFANGQPVFRGKTKNKIDWFPCYQDAVENSQIAFEEPVKVVLTIAHLDHDELNHEVKLERLAALCQLCHLRYDAKEKYRRVMSGSNSR